MRRERDLQLLQPVLRNLNGRLLQERDIGIESLVGGMQQDHEWTNTLHRMPFLPCPQPLRLYAPALRHVSMPFATRLLYAAPRSLPIMYRWGSHSRHQKSDHTHPPAGLLSASGKRLFRPFRARLVRQQCRVLSCQTP